LADETLDSDEFENLDEENGDIWIQSLWLSKEDRDILKNGECLNDKLIAAALLFLKKQHSGYGGLTDPLLVQALKVNCKHEVFAQVVHDGSNHWAAVSNKACSDGTVRYYDSLNRVPNNFIKKQVAALASYDTVNMNIERMSVSKQTNGFDCGVMAIAFVTCLLFEQDPVNVRFDMSKMRPHLLTCLEHGRVTPFPVLSYRAVRMPVLGICSDELFCTCRQVFVDGDDQMIECSVCRVWYHPTCEGLSDSVFKKLSRKNSKFTCSQCLRQ
jgi:hypothetical protein